MFGFLDLDEGVAVRDRDGSVTFSELKRILARLASDLDAMGLRAGDRVAAVLPNSLELLAGYYACLLKGLVIVPIDERLTTPEVASIFAHCQPRAAITGPAGRRQLPDQESKSSVPMLVLDSVRHWLADRDRDDAEHLCAAWPPEHPAVLFYTSGSTGAPKGVLYAHRTLSGNCRVYGEGLSIKPSDHAVLCHSMCTNFVFAQLTVPFLDVGATVEIVRYGDVAGTLDAIDRGATFLSLIPWFGFRLIDAARSRPPRPNRLRVTEVGGDRVPDRFFTDFQAAFGIRPREHLGMAEANTFVVNPPVGRGYRAGSVGKPLPHVELEIRDSAGRDLGLGAEGQIWVRSPANMVGYWNDPEATRGAMTEGWVATGDVGTLDSDGYLWYAGRIKRIIICDGDNIHPGEVERALAEHPGVDRACVVGLPDEARGEIVAAAIIPVKAGAGPNERDVARFLSPRLTEVKVPKRILTLARFPETVAGKIDREQIVDAMLRCSHDRAAAAD